MDNLQKRRCAAFNAVLQFASEWPAEMSNQAVQATVAELRQTHEAVFALDQKKGSPKGAKDRTSQIAAWMQALRRDHLMVLKTASEVHLNGEDGRPLVLKVPPFRAKPAEVLAAARDFESTLRPHLPTLIAKGLPADMLDQLGDAADQLERARQATDEIKTHKSLRIQINEQISRGLKLIELLRRLLGRAFADNVVLKTQFEKAAKVEDKPGPPKEKMTVTNMKKRERRHRKRPLARPRRT